MIARALAGQGARLAVSGSNRAKLDAFREDLGGDHVALPCDLSDAAAVDQLVPQAVAALEGVRVDGPVVGQPFASGMAAISTVLMALTRAGAHVVAPREVYGGTYGLLTSVLARFGVETDFVDMTDLDAVRAALDAGQGLSQAVPAIVAAMAPQAGPWAEFEATTARNAAAAYAEMEWD